MGANRTNSPLSFACSCGQVHGTLSASIINAGTHLVCFCKDCRTAEIALGRKDPAPAPINILQTTPDGIVFDEGQDKLALLRLSPGGLMRWYASCCNTPLFNTLKSPKLPFVGVLTDCLDDATVLGPVAGRGFVPQSDGTTKHDGAGVTVWGIATRLLASRLSGRWKTTPFFDTKNGQPRVKARVLSKDARKAATPR